MWLGFLEDDFSFCGHDFVILTLRGDEELEASRVAGDYENTVGHPRAIQWAQIAMALVSVDGDSNFCPAVGPSKKDHARARFNWVTSNWYWPLGQYLFGRYTALLERQIEAVKAVQDLLTGNRTISTPSADSSTDKGSSEPTMENILDYLD